MSVSSFRVKLLGQAIDALLNGVKAVQSAITEIKETNSLFAQMHGISWQMMISRLVLQGLTLLAIE